MSFEQDRVKMKENTLSEKKIKKTLRMSFEQDLVHFPHALYADARQFDRACVGFN